MQNGLEDDDMIRINKRKFIAAALILLVSGMFIGQQLVQAKSDTYEELRGFTQVLELIRKNYVENPDSRELIQGGIRGMVSSLDPGAFGNSGFRNFVFVGDILLVANPD